jgi:hypothetical protein
VKARVVTDPEADDQALRIDTWWRENRRDAPDLFVEELEGAFALLEGAPAAGRRYDRGAFPAFAG